MFTGIVAELGEVAGVDHHGDAARLTIRGSTEGVALGESIAVNGVCLTVTGILDGTFTADVMGETLSRSGLGALTPGDPVNLERSVRLADRMGGHLVQGHVDATATIISRTPAEHWDQVRITLPDDTEHRQRRRAPMASKSAAQRWGEDRERAWYQALTHPQPEPVTAPEQEAITRTEVPTPRDSWTATPEPIVRNPAASPRSRRSSTCI